MDKEQLLEQVEKLKAKRYTLDNLDDIRNINFKINLCLLRLGIADYDLYSKKFIRHQE